MFFPLECKPQHFDNHIHPEYDWHGSHICYPTYNSDKCNYDGGTIFFGWYLFSFFITFISGVHVLLVSLFGIPIVGSISNLFGWPKKKLVNQKKFTLSCYKISNTGLISWVTNKIFLWKIHEFFCIYALKLFIIMVILVKCLKPIWILQKLTKLFKGGY